MPEYSAINPATEISKEEKSRRKKAARELKKHSEKLAEYNRNMEILGDRNSYSKTDKDATFMHMKEDAMVYGLAKVGDKAEIGDKATICDKAEIRGNAKIRDAGRGADSGDADRIRDSEVFDIKCRESFQH